MVTGSEIDDLGVSEGVSSLNLGAKNEHNLRMTDLILLREAFF